MRNNTKNPLHSEYLQKNHRTHVFHTDEQGCLYSYKGPGGVLTVPDGVTSIGAEAFAFRSQVTGVILPEGVLSIGKQCFFRSGVQTVSLPNSLTRIEERAFSDTPLKSIKIPDQATIINKYAFSGAKHLEKVQLPEGITRLEPSIFAGCSSLKEIVIPEGVERIGQSAFLNCTSLESVQLPEKLLTLSTRSFDGCSALREIYLGDNVNTIGYAVFRNCTALEKVRIPKKLILFSDTVFEGDERVVLTGPGQINGLILSGSVLIYGSPALKKLLVPEGVTKINQCALHSLSSLEVLDLPASLKYYSWHTFARIRSLRQIVTDQDALAAEIALLLDLECVDRNGLPFTFRVPETDGEWITGRDEEHDGIRIEGVRGRKGQTGSARYTTVVIPDEIDGIPVTCIGAGAFDGYDYADAFYIPDTVQRIESKAFGRCGCCQFGLQLFVRMPKEVSLAEDAFEGTEYFTKEA